MIFLGADHAGYELKEFIKETLAHQGVAFEDYGTYNPKLTDSYPIYAKKVAKAVLKHRGRGILVCGSGQGMSIVANRYPGIRAALSWNNEAARRSREEDDANILCLPSRFVSLDQGWEIVSTFLSTTFSHLDRYKRRLEQIDG